MPVLSCRRLAAIALPAAIAGVLFLTAARAQAQQQPPDPLKEWRDLFEGLNQDWQDLADWYGRWIDQQAGRYGQQPQVRVPPEPQFPRPLNGAGTGDGAKDTPTSTTEVSPADEGDNVDAGDQPTQEDQPAGKDETEQDPVTALLGVLGYGGGAQTSTTPAATEDAPACDAIMCPPETGAQPQPPKDDPEDQPEDAGGDIVTAPQFGVQAPDSAQFFDAGIVGPTVLVTTNPEPLDQIDRRTTTEPLDLDGLTLTNEPTGKEPGGLGGIFDQDPGSTSGGWGDLGGWVLDPRTDIEITKPVTPDIYDPGPRRMGGEIDLAA